MVNHCQTTVKDNVEVGCRADYADSTQCWVVELLSAV